MHIDKLVIKGFRKFKDFEINFNKDLNVIVGENETGKSTILEALDLVLNGRNINTEYLDEQIFNIENLDHFYKKPEYNNLPRIVIEIYLQFNEDDKLNKQYFYGLHYGDKNKSESLAGIRFEARFDEEFKEDFERINFERNQLIPVELYRFETNTFQGGRYNKRKGNVKSLLIDNSKADNVYNSYAKQVFNQTFEEKERHEITYSFRNSIKDYLSEQKDSLKVGQQQVGIDYSKAVFSRLIDISENNISIQNKGKGKENFIKTEIALETESNIILVEEPENHLSHSYTRQLIDLIRQKNESNQIILTTHSPLVVNRLNLQKLIWINKSCSQSLSDITDETAQYFEKLDNTNLLEFILSTKIILVEGAAEYMYIPSFFKKIYNSEIDQDGIHIISGNGISYKNYIEIAQDLKKPLLIITDNDKKQQTVDEIDNRNVKFKEEGYDIKIVCDENTEKYTFEKVLFEENILTLEDWKEESKVSTLVDGENVGNKALAYMLKYKTESAYQILEDRNLFNKLNVPNYIEEGLNWLVEL